MGSTTREGHRGSHARDLWSDAPVMTHGATLDTRMIRLALAQHDFLVGDISGNLKKSLALLAEARTAGADLLLFPELALTGYPPEDLLLRPGFMRAVRKALQLLASGAGWLSGLIGFRYSEYGEIHGR